MTSFQQQQKDRLENNLILGYTVRLITRYLNKRKGRRKATLSVGNTASYAMVLGGLSGHMLTRRSSVSVYTRG
jgi:hypothetical protein